MDNIAEELLSVPSETVETPVEPTPTPEVVADAEQETPEPEAPEAGDKAETQPDTPPVSDAAKTVPESALIGLRKDLSSKITALEEQLAAKPEPAAPKVDFFEDPDGALVQLRSELTTEMANTLLNAGEAEAVDQYDQETVTAAIAWATEAAKNSPYLAEQFAKTPSLQVHRKAVTLHKQELARAEQDSPDVYKAKIREEVKAELAAEAQAAQDEKDKLAKSIPKSLTGDSSKGGLTGSDWSGPVELGSVIGPGG